MKPHTTAHQLLSIVFEGHKISAFIENDKSTFARNEVTAACGISNAQKSIIRHVDPDELGCTKIQVRSANGTTQTRTIATLTESGVIALVCASQKPAARRFRRWLTEEVIPQLLKYGTYIPGATTGERCAALRGRWLEERANGKARDAEAYAASGLLTIAAFRKVSPVPVRNVLEFCAVLRSKATLAGYEPQRFYTGPKRHTPAWPQELLHEAARATTHFLPYSLES